MLTPVQRQALRAPRSMGVRSVAFQHGTQIPREFTRRGDDINPPLSWTGVPPAAQALAIVVDDPDAPADASTLWTAWNLPARLDGVEAGAKLVPIGGVEGRNGAGTIGYAGPDPESGAHRYAFRVLALDRPIDLARGASAEDVWRRLSGHVIAWGEIIGTLRRA